MSDVIPSTGAAAVPAAAPVPAAHYTATAQVLHWVVAALMFAVVALAWVMMALPEQNPSRDFYFTLHKSVGLTILLLVAVRLAWRASHPAPRLPGHLAAWERAAAYSSHWLLYAILLLMPISGYVMSAAGGHPVTYFGLFTLPGLPHDRAVSGTAFAIHVAFGQWAVYALVSLHLLATAWHVAVRRDGVLARMLPPPDPALRS